MSKKYTSKDFINAARAKGYVARAAMGFMVPNTPQAMAPQVGASTIGAAPLPGQTAPNQGNTVQGGALGFLTPQNSYQAQLAPTTQYNYGAPMQSALNQSTAGYNAAQGNIGAEQALAQQYQGLASGTGPSLAQNILAQGTGANVANQAALMAGNRGASANAGLIGRQAGQQGAAIQQGATSQAANLGLQQQLGALGAQSGLYGQIGQQAQGIQSGGNSLYGTTVAGNNTQNANNISNYQQMQNINAQIAQQNANAASKTANGIQSGLSSEITSAALMAKGGEVGPMSYAGKFLSQNYDDGGEVATVNTPTLQGPPAAPASSGSSSSSGGGGMSSMMSMAPMLLAMLNKGGPAPVVGETLAAKGKMVPGKAKAKGDTLKNDVVPAMLSPGEIVIPRSIAQHPNAPSKAAAFVQAIQAKHRANRK